MYQRIRRRYCQNQVWRQVRHLQIRSDVKNWRTFVLSSLRVDVRLYAPFRMPLRSSCPDVRSSPFAGSSRFKTTCLDPRSLGNTFSRASDIFEKNVTSLLTWSVDVSSSEIWDVFVLRNHVAMQICQDNEWKSLNDHQTKWSRLYYLR